MSYEPTEWATGDTVTSDKLNKLEEGVANASEDGVLVVTVTGSDDNYISDTTFSEIKTAITNGKFVVLCHSDNEGSYDYYNLSECYLSDNPEEAEYEYVVFSKTSITNAVSTVYFRISYDDSVSYESAIYPSNDNNY